ncbi:MAG: type II secretion system protein [Candidatus Omnitrophica bacterium]|nr:type II secretion system protein [Candidatus Omnitrophota bacterium]
MKTSKNGFTLLEVLLSLAIIAVTLAGLLLTYINVFVLADIIRDSALASNAVAAKLEEIKNMDFDNLTTAAGPFNLTDYGFTSTQPSKGRVEVTTSFSGYPATLTKVRIVGCYATRYNRTIGEDLNFNGVLDGSEDQNGNSRLDSSIEVVSLIAE